MDWEIKKKNPRMIKMKIIVKLKDDANEPEFYDYIHQLMSYDKRILVFEIKDTRVVPKYRRNENE